MIVILLIKETGISAPCDKLYPLILYNTPHYDGEPKSWLPWLIALVQQQM